MVAGKLMPDAYQGYDMPISGVVAVDNAVIPEAFRFATYQTFVFAKEVS